MKTKNLRKTLKNNIKKYKKLDYGIAHILSSFNNTIINITDNLGNTITWTTSSMSGLKNLKKSTTYSAQIAAEIAGKKAIIYGLKSINVIVKGVGGGREFAIRGLANVGLKIISICDITPIPHNGCKPRKARRI